jgi:sulfate adenylyltransferase subunit 2
LDAIDEFKFACIGGGARRDEKQGKERIFSVQDDFGQWDEKNQRPELFDILNGKIENGQNVRVFQYQLDRTRCVELYRREQIEIHPFIFS